MRINVSKNLLLSKLRAVGKIVKPSSRETMYSVFFVQIENESSITIAGSDETGRITTTVDCMIEDFKQVSFLLDAQILQNGLKEIPEQPIVIIVDPENAKSTFKYKNGKFEMAALDASIYPSMPEMKESANFKISGSVLSNGFGAVAKFAATDDAMRPIMSAVNVSCENNHVAFAASTGHALSIYEDEVNDTVNFNFNVPQRIAKIAIDFMPVNDTPIDVSVSETNAFFKLSEYTIMYRLIEGRYPNFRAVVPKNPDMTIKVDSADLMAAINRVSVFTDDVSSMIVLETSQNNLILSAEDFDFSRSANESMMLNEIYNHIKIGFKSTFMADVLKTISAYSKTCEILFSGPDKAAIFRPNNSIHITIILMPLIVNN